MILIKIEAAYENGHEYTRTVFLPDPEPDEDIDGLDGWWNTKVWNETGSDGFGSGGHCTEAVVIASDDDRLPVGADYEWAAN